MDSLRWIAAAIGLTGAVVGGCAGDRSCLGGDCEATRPCGALSFACATPRLYLGPVAGAPAELRLAYGQGADGDTLVSNGVVTAVIGALDAPMDLAPTGGNLIDLGPAGGVDDLTILYQLAGILPDDAFAYESLELVDRAPAYVAVVARGHLDGRADVPVATRYELRPCDPGLRVRSELSNGGPLPLTFVIADTAHWGKRRVVPFVPRPGQGYQQPPLELLELTSLWSAQDYLGAATPMVDAPGYGEVACNQERLHGVADLEVSAVGTDIEIVGPGDALVLERMIVSAGRGEGPAAAIAPLLAARGQLFGERSRAVHGAVTAGGLAFGGDVRRASIMIVRASDRVPLAAVVPGADGRWQAEVADVPVDWELWSFGRQVAEGAVGADGDAGAQVAPAPATVQLGVTLDGPGPARAIHSLVVVEPADEATRAAVAGSFHGRLDRCAPWLGPPIGGSPACNRVLVPPTGVEVEIPAGHYWIYASAGPERTLARREVWLATGELTDVELALRPLAVRAPGWLAADLHVHGRASFDSGIPDRDRVTSFVAAGVDVIAATDHDFVNDYAAAVSELAVDDQVLVIGGLETTQLIPWLDVPGEDVPRVIGHFNFWPLTPVPGAPRGGAPWDERVEPGELFDRMAPLVGDDGVFMINHPWDEPVFGRDLGYLRAVGFDPRAPMPATPADGGNGALLRAPAGGHRNLDWHVMEVQNGAGADELAKTRPLWFALISAGYPVAGAASSDSHGLRDNQLGWGRTWVEVGRALADTTIADFDRALRDGRSVGGTGIFVDVAVGEAGVPRRGLGLEPVVPRAGDELMVTVRAAPWIPVSEVRIVTSRGVVRRIGGLAAPADPFGTDGVVRWHGRIGIGALVAGADDWIVVEAGLPLPPYADLDDDGVLDTGDNDGDGDVDLDDVEPDEDVGPIASPPDPADPADPRFHMTRIVPESWPSGFTSPLLVDVDGDGWTPPGVAP
jgi:hypothetical protein